MMNFSNIYGGYLEKIQQNQQRTRNRDLQLDG